jgi:oligopeptide transport system ATP-binding protein
MSAKNQPLIAANDLKMHFTVGRTISGKPSKILKAVDGVSFTIDKGETMGLVGESGCGKTTVGRALTRLYKPTAGKVTYEGNDITSLGEKELIPYRRKMQMIFQDPYASLDPRMTVNAIISEPLQVTNMTRHEKDERVKELLSTVGLKSDHGLRYPHEFSGGQRQRIGIARALAAGPEFIVCDEPISALDVSIQAQVVNMLEELQERLQLTYLFVSHDLSMVRHISRRVGVMYLGSLVELATVDELYANMQHPYTKALLSAVPIADPDLAEKSQRIILQGDVPTPINPPAGCPFCTRCPYVMPRCKDERPVLKDLGAGHLAACHLLDK